MLGECSLGNSLEDSITSFVSKELGDGFNSLRVVLGDLPPRGDSLGDCIEANEVFLLDN